MEQQALQVALISEQAARSEAVAKVMAEKGWKVLTISSRSNPVAALKRQPVDLALVDLDVPNAIALLGELTHQLPYMRCWPWRLPNIWLNGKMHSWPAHWTM